MALAVQTALPPAIETALNDARLNVAGSKLKIVPGNPLRASASILCNPLGLSLPDIDQFLASHFLC